MTNVYSFVEDFLLAQQFAQALAVIAAECPDEGLRDRLSTAPVTVLAPADTGLVHAALEFGFDGTQPAEALRHLIAHIATHLGLSRVQATLQIVQAHIAQGCHRVPHPGRARVLTMLTGAELGLTAAGLQAPGDGPRSSLMICDQFCDNGVVHVIARPILPQGLRAQPKAAAMSVQRSNGFAAPPQARFRSAFIAQPETRVHPAPSGIAAGPQVLIDREADSFRFRFEA